MDTKFNSLNLIVQWGCVYPTYKSQTAGNVPITQRNVYMDEYPLPIAFTTVGYGICSATGSFYGAPYTLMSLIGVLNCTTIGVAYCRDGSPTTNEVGIGYIVIGY